MFTPPKKPLQTLIEFQNILSESQGLSEQFGYRWSIILRRLHEIPQIELQKTNQKLCVFEFGSQSLKKKSLSEFGITCDEQSFRCYALKGDEKILFEGTMSQDNIEKLASILKKSA
jgi:hypothetical protein